jgi:hypothetical protein
VTALHTRHPYSCALIIGVLIATTDFQVAPASAANKANGQRSQLLADDCSAQVIDPKQWKLQCKSSDFALFCDKAGEEKKCACIKGAKYYNTFGVHCSDLPCFHKVCK